MSRSLALLLLVLLPAAALAQDEPEEEATSPLVAAGWCVVQDGQEAAEEDAIGCDAGLGVSLGGGKRLRFVAVIGGHSFGPGLAWVAARPKRGPVIAVAIGIVAPWSTAGIDPHPRLALGATFGF